MSYADSVLLGRLAVALVCGVAVLGVRLPVFVRMSKSGFTAFALGAILASRIALFALLFLVFDYPVSGDAQTYLDQGRRALEGELVYRDFRSSYAPLFPYVVAAGLALWDSDRMLVVLAIAAEGLAFPLWLGACRRLLPEAVTRTAALLYAASPIALLNVAVQGQNNVWTGLLLALSLRVIVTQDLVSGAACGLAVSATKLLAALFAPVLWLFARERARWMVGFGLLAGVVYGGGSAVLGGDILHPLYYETMRVTPGNLLFLTSAFGVDLGSRGVLLASTAVTLASLGFVLCAAWLRGVARRPEQVFPLLALVMLVFLLTSKKSYTSYLVMGLFPLCVAVASTGPRAALLYGFGLLGVLCAVDVNLWFRWVETRDLSLLSSATLPAGVTRWRVAVFAGVEAAIACLYVAFAVASGREVFGGQRTDAQPTA